LLTKLATRGEEASALLKKVKTIYLPATPKFDKGVLQNPQRSGKRPLKVQLITIKAEQRTSGQGGADRTTREGNGEESWSLNSQESGSMPGSETCPPERSYEISQALANKAESC